MELLEAVIYSVFETALDCFLYVSSLAIAPTLLVPHCHLPPPYCHLSRTLDVTVSAYRSRSHRALESSPSSSVRHLRRLRIGASSCRRIFADLTGLGRSVALSSMANKVGQRSLLLKLRYPEICMEFKYDPSFPIRGLYYDKSKGLPNEAEFLRQSRREFRDVYETRHIGCDQARSLVGLTDFFYFSEAFLLADIVQYFVTGAYRKKLAERER
ncbi:hypothetical protein AHAS_Ahas15G0000500 [Arachis hypogaea]